MTCNPKVTGLHLAGDYINANKVRVLARFDAATEHFKFEGVQLIIYPDGAVTVWPPKKSDGVVAMRFASWAVRDEFRDAALLIFKALGGELEFGSPTACEAPAGYLRRAREHAA